MTLGDFFPQKSPLYESINTFFFFHIKWQKFAKTKKNSWNEVMIMHKTIQLGLVIWNLQV
jgi:hypothetical protein